MNYLSVSDMGFPCVKANTVTHMQSEVYCVCAWKVNILWIFSLLDLLLLLLYWQKTPTHIRPKHGGWFRNEHRTFLMA